MRQNTESEKPEQVVTPIMLPAGFKPGLLSVTVDAVIARLEPRLTGRMLSVYEKNKARVRRVISLRLAKAKQRVLADRAQRKTTGETKTVAQEGVALFSSVEDAKQAVIQMAAGLASLPPPTEEDFMGFSAVTDAPLRAFLARNYAGLATDEDYLFAARLLIHHSKTQLPRDVVMGAVRALEADQKPERVTPANASRPDPKDTQIFWAQPLLRGEIPLIDTSMLKWTFDDKKGIFSFTTRKLPFREVRDFINESGGNTAIRVVENRGQYAQYFLDVPIFDIPRLILYLRSRDELAEAAARLTAAWEAGWTREAEQRSPTKTKAAEGVMRGTRSPSGEGNGFEIEGLEPLLPRPLDGSIAHGTPEEGGLRVKGQKFDGFHWKVTKNGVVIGIASTKISDRVVGGPSGSLAALYGFSSYLRREYGANTEVTDFKLLVRTSPTKLAELLVDWSQTDAVRNAPRLSLLDGIEPVMNKTPNLDALFSYLPLLTKAWASEGTDTLVQIPVAAQLSVERKKVEEEKKPVVLAGPPATRTTPLLPSRKKAGNTVDLKLFAPKLHTTWEELVAGSSPQIVADLAFAYEWARLIPTQDAGNETITTKTGIVIEDASRTASAGFKGIVPLPSEERQIELIAAIAREFSSPSFRACRGVFVVPTEWARDKEVLFDALAASHKDWAGRSTFKNPSFRATAIVIGTDEPEEVFGWAVYQRLKTDSSGKPIPAKDKNGKILLKPDGSIQYATEPRIMVTRAAVNDRMDGSLLKAKAPQVSLQPVTGGVYGGASYHDTFGVWCPSFEIEAQNVSRFTRALDELENFVPAYSLRIAFLSDYMVNCPTLYPVAQAATLSEVPEPQRGQIVHMADWGKIEYLNKEFPGGPKKMGLMPFQQIGASFVWLNGGRALIGDAMGLGKTVQAIAAVRIKAPKTLPVLVVCPSSVMYNWATEIERWYPEATVFIGETAKLREGLPPAAHKANFVILGWGSAKKYGPLFHSWLKTLIVDEVHYGKKVKSARAEGARELAQHAEYVIALSGTPLDNAKLEEMWSPLAMVSPTMFGTDANSQGYYKFRANFVPSGSTEYKGLIPTWDSVDNLRRRLSMTRRCFMVRRLKEQVPLGLGKKERQYVEVQLTPEQRRLYQTEVKEVLKAVVKSIKKRRVDYALSLLRGTTLGPALNAANELEYDPRKIAEVGFVVYNVMRQASSKVKTPYAIQRIMDRLQEYPKDPIVVFVEFDSTLQLLLQAMDKKGVPYVYINGTVPAKERQERVLAFQRDKDNTKVKVFFGTKAAREGITLTRANYTLFVDRWFVPAWEEQAEDRTYRFTQTRDVLIEFMVAKQTVDEDINAMIQRKRQIIADVISEDKFEETEGKTDEEVEEEYGADIFEKLANQVAGLSDIDPEETLITEDDVIAAAAGVKSLQEEMIEYNPKNPPAARAQVQAKLWSYIKAEGGRVSREALVEVGFTKQQISTGLDAHHLIAVRVPKILRNSPKAAPSPALPKASWVVKPGSMVVRKISSSPRLRRR